MIWTNLKMSECQNQMYSLRHKSIQKNVLKFHLMPEERISAQGQYYKIR
jgi:hypothetical protein